MMKASSGSSFPFLNMEPHGHLAPVAWRYKSKKMRPRAAAGLTSGSTRKMGLHHDVSYARDDTRPPRFSADDFCNIDAILPIRSRPAAHDDGDDTTQPSTPEEEHQRHVEGIGRLINIFNPSIVIDGAQYTLPSEDVLEVTVESQYVQPCCSTCKTEDTTQWRRGPKGRRVLCSDCAEAYPPKRRKRLDASNTTSALSSSENTGDHSVWSRQK